MPAPNRKLCFAAKYKVPLDNRMRRMRGAFRVSFHGEFSSRGFWLAFGAFSIVAAEVLVCVVSVAVWAQPATKPPRFEDYPIREAFKGTPSAPSLVTPEERRYRTVIRRGVEMGYGVAEPPIGKERRGPNFAGHYFIVRWGCGSPCLMAAIVDAKSGHILPPPFHLGPRNSCFQVPWNFPMEPLDYRLNSRLLIAIFAERIAKQKLTIGPFINPNVVAPTISSWAIEGSH